MTDARNFSEIREQFTTKIVYRPIGLKRAILDVLKHMYYYGDTITENQYRQLALKYSKQESVIEELIHLFEDAFYYIEENDMDARNAVDTKGNTLFF